MNEFVRFFNVGLPIRRCNLHCHYCFYDQQKNRVKSADETLHYSFDVMKRALSPNRLSGVCMFNLCGAGETLLFEPLPKLVEMLLSMGHFVSVVTNALPEKPLFELISLPSSLTKRLFIKCSLHYNEYVQKALMTKFFKNIHAIKAAGISFSVETIANDEEIPFIDEMKKICVENIGAMPHVAESRDEGRDGFPRLTKLPLSEHQKYWRQLDSPLFDFQQVTYEKPIDHFCYAGEYGIYLDIQTGRYMQCDSGKALGNIFENISELPQFCAVGKNCPKKHCHVSYVWSALCGCYTLEDMYTPSYVQMRDRIGEDETHWLTPIFQDVFSHKCSDFKPYYSQEKKRYADLLMRKLFTNEEPTEAENTDIALILKKQLKGVENIAIYGFGRLGQWLYKRLIFAGINVPFVVDKEIFSTDFDILVLPPNGNLPLTDLIIVTPFAEYYKITDDLKRITSAKSISILNIMEG